MDLNRQAESLRKEIEAVREEFGKVIVGNREILDYMLKALFAGGHILLEGLPGLGKTLMVRTVARLLDLDFSRIQFTPDLMPADILGVNILVEDKGGRRSFHFEKGPVFTNILLADEINRATPKTQSALLQVMEEKHITIFGADHKLDDFFLVLATQNPIELKGTYPLPEAQLDRFMFKVNIAYPSRENLESIARFNIDSSGALPLPPQVLDRDRVSTIRDFINRIPVSDEIYQFASSLVYATNPSGESSPAVTTRHIRYGSSPRGLIALLAGSKISAFLDGRFNLSYEDLKENYLPALRHRVILRFEAQVAKVQVDDVLSEIFESIEKPH
jgi:MoxR-like ATPase